MTEHLIKLARERLQDNETMLARRLDVSVGCLRNWSRRGAPRYGRLALAALISNIDPNALVYESRRTSSERQLETQLSSP
jgi:DNA-binding transcriptional regulator YiaG